MPAANHKRKYVEVSCKDCGVTWLKREDALKQWGGRCHPCGYRFLHENPEYRAKIAQTLTGKFVGPLNPNWVAPRHCIDCRKTLSKKSKQNIRCYSCFTAYHRGEKHWNWQRGKSSEGKLVRTSQAYEAWRRAVFTRDKFTCQNCEKRGGDLQADHILPFSLYKEQRLEVSNGRTLCRPCHTAIGWNRYRLAFASGQIPPINVA